MKNYESKNFYRLICQGKLREAVDYLKNFPSKKRLVKKYEAVFESDSPVIRSKNEVINQIDAIFQKYYRNVFWRGMKKEDAFIRLCSRISVFLNYKLPDTKSFNDLEQLWENEIEPQIKEVVEKESFHYLGGKTQGYYGPYIWIKTVPKTYRVQLPAHLLFHEDYVNDAVKWKGKRNKVKNYSLQLYQEYPDHTSES